MLIFTNIIALYTLHIIRYILVISISLSEIGTYMSDH